MDGSDRGGHPRVPLGVQNSIFKRERRESGAWTLKTRGWGGSTPRLGRPNPALPDPQTPPSPTFSSWAPFSPAAAPEAALQGVGASRRLKTTQEADVLRRTHLTPEPRKCRGF